MNDYKIEFKGGSAGYPAKDLKEAHKIAKDWHDKGWYILYKKNTNPVGWLRVGDNYAH